MTFETNSTPSALANTVSGLASTANTLLQQYKNKTITLQQLKDSVNTQVIAAFTGISDNASKDTTVNGVDMHTISVAIRMIGSPD